MTFTYGTVIHGTHRLQDLIPVFMDELKDRDEKRWADLVRLFLTTAVTEGWNAEDAHELLYALLDSLDETAPDGTYFGTHPGDGSDFGFWPIELLD